MQATFILSLLSVLLATWMPVNALKCMQCTAWQEFCMDQEMTCTAPEDTCSSRLGESTMGVLKYTGFMKGCMATASCSAGTVTVTVGSSLTLRSAVECCKQDSCNSNSPTLSPVNTTWNGLQCPMCYSKDSVQCESKETMCCTGAEDHCISMAGTLVTHTGDPSSISLTVRGCATRTACALKKGFHVYTGLYSYLVSTVDTCTPAQNSASWIPGPSSFAFLLPSLLLLKYLS